MPLIGFGKSFTNFARPIAAAASGTVRGRPLIENNAVLSAERTRLRGVTMALDGPGTLTNIYTTNRANWQKFRDLKLNIVRVPFSIEYEGNTLASMLPDMDAAVANASATGMYCMFMLDGAYGIANYDEFERVWPTVASRYKDNTNVLYEMNNEPHWISSHFSTASVDRIANVYNLMHTAAPNTLIGLLTPASLQDGAQATINVVNMLKARGVTFGPAFVATHVYSGFDQQTGLNLYSTQHLIDLKAAVPCLVTETASGGPANNAIPDNETYKIQQIESIPGVGWMVLSPRTGEVSNEDTPYGNDETTFTGRIVSELTAAGSYNWPQDVISGSRRALPAGQLFAPRLTLAPGVAGIGAPGAVAGRVFAVAASFARGTAVGTAGTVTPPKSITLTPANPGSIQQITAGATVNWNTVVSVQNITSGVTWAIIKADGTQRGAAVIIANNNSNYNITVPFVETGDKLRVWETGNTAVNRDSGAVTVIAATAREITISPMSPGTVTAGVAVPTTITTRGITNITYVVVDPDYGWRNGSVSVAMAATGQTRIVNIFYNTDQQFLKVFDTNDPNFKLDALAVTITQTAPEPGTGFFEGFDNNTTGQLSHIWGNRNQLSINNGIIRLQGLPGLDPWANACGVMVWPGGANQGFGYGLYEMRIRMSDYLGDGSGACALLWPADDVWPGGEEDLGEISRDGDWYIAHHWKGPNDANGNPTDRFLYHTVPGFNPTVWHTTACRLKRDYIEFILNGQVIISYTESVTRVFGDGPGGCNRVMGIMNRSSTTWIECDWARFTPEGP